MSEITVGCPHGEELDVSPIGNYGLRFQWTGWYDGGEITLRREEVEKLNAWLTEWLRRKTEGTSDD